MHRLLVTAALLAVAVMAAGCGSTASPGGSAATSPAASASPSRSNELATLPVFIDDSPVQTILDLGAKLRRLKSKQSLDLVIVDYLQLMRGHLDSDNREQEISNISGRSKLSPRSCSTGHRAESVEPGRGDPRGQQKSYAGRPERIRCQV